MPRASGFEVLEWLREKRTRNRGTPDLVVSAMGDRESVDRCSKIGASVYTVNPILRETLAAAVRERLPSQSTQADEDGEHIDSEMR
jgi:DNA-binding response OmpR family regulator